MASGQKWSGSLLKWPENRLAKWLDGLGVNKQKKSGRLLNGQKWSGRLLDS